MVRILGVHGMANNIVLHATTQCRMPAPKGMASQHLLSLESGVYQNKLKIVYYYEKTFIYLILIFLLLPHVMKKEIIKMHILKSLYIYYIYSVFFVILAGNNFSL